VVVAGAVGVVVGSGGVDGGWVVSVVFSEPSSTKLLLETGAVLFQAVFGDFAMLGVVLTKKKSASQTNA
jgi:hypothetical protein